MSADRFRRTDAANLKSGQNSLSISSLQPTTEPERVGDAKWKVRYKMSTLNSKPPSYNLAAIMAGRHIPDYF